MNSKNKISKSADVRVAYWDQQHQITMESKLARKLVKIYKMAIDCGDFVPANNSKVVAALEDLVKLVEKK
jgi:hypothetical protein